MFTQSIFGHPTHCPNRKCGHEFYKQSHLGYLPKSETEVYAVMRCPSETCRDTFMVGQMISTAMSYFKRLPSDPKLNKKKELEKISFDDIREVQENLEKETNPFATLFEGPRPDTPNYGFHEQ